MIKLHQTKFGDKQGNCFATCVACLFDIKDVDSVPNFCVDYDDWFKAFCDFISQYGYTAIMLTPNHEVRARLKDTLMIAGGMSPRGINHAVIVKGEELVWDPHPDNTGLLKIEDVTVLIPKEIIKKRKAAKNNKVLFKTFGTIRYIGTTIKELDFGFGDGGEIKNIFVAYNCRTKEWFLAAEEIYITNYIDDYPNKHPGKVFKITFSEAVNYIGKRIALKMKDSK